MKIHEPLTHWNNFTLPELKQILEHCVALEALGIAQDEEMTLDIERDITLREKRSEGDAYRTEVMRKLAQRSEQEPPRLLEQTA
jgi:hypothetical protein